MVEGKLTMKKPKVQPFQVRLPVPVYNQVVEYREKKPYVSLNAFMVEAAVKLLDAKRKEEAV
jgi:hypothetical protein